MLSGFFLWGLEALARPLVEASGTRGALRPVCPALVGACAPQEGLEGRGGSPESFWGLGLALHGPLVTLLVAWGRVSPMCPGFHCAGGTAQPDSPLHSQTCLAETTQTCRI